MVPPYTSESSPRRHTSNRSPTTAVSRIQYDLMSTFGRLNVLLMRGILVMREISVTIAALAFDGGISSSVRRVRSRHIGAHGRVRSTVSMPYPM